MLCSGFAEYSHETATYTDIKFNVMVKGKDYNIIAEMQFLFTEMFLYKKIAHSLYNIERRREFIDNMTDILGIKLDLTKQLFIHAARDNIKGLTDLMVTHDFKNEDLMKLNQRNQSILTPICFVNCSKTLRYLMKQVDNEMLRRRLVFVDASRRYPLRLAVQKNHFNGVVKDIMEKKELDLADYQSFSSWYSHVSNNCWDTKSAKSALLILINIKDKERRNKLIEKVYTCYNVARTGNHELLSFVWDQLKSSERVREKWLAKRDNHDDGKWYFHQYVISAILHHVYTVV